MIYIIDNIYLDSDENSFQSVIWNGNRDKNGNMIGLNRRFYRTLEGAINSIGIIMIRRNITNAPNLMELKELNHRTLLELEKITKSLT